MIHAADLLGQIQDALAGIPPARQLTGAEEKDFRALLRKAEHLAASLREPPEPDEAERPDPLGAGAKIHALALAEIEASKGRLTYAAALGRVCLAHGELVREWQQSVQASCRRR